MRVASLVLYSIRAKEVSITKEDIINYMIVKAVQWSKIQGSNHCGAEHKNNNHAVRTWTILRLPSQLCSLQYSDKFEAVYLEANITIFDFRQIFEIKFI